MNEIDINIEDPILARLAYNYIQTQSQFDDFMAFFKEHKKDIPYIAVDTEFLRRTTYYPKLCLLQIALPNRVTYLIDPLTIENLEGLKPVLEDPQITKIFHASSQDIEIFVNLFGSAPKGIFDTQIAANYCLTPADEKAETETETETEVKLPAYDMSYANLINWLCDTSLDKSSQQTDWSKRPLAEEHLHYASADVVYLLDAYELLKEKLENNGNLHKVTEDFIYLSHHKTYEKSLDELFAQFKKKDIPEESHAQLYALVQWREVTARTKDKPRTHIIRDDLFKDILTSSQSHQDLLSILEKNKKSQYLPGIKEALKQSAKYTHLFENQENTPPLSPNIYKEKMAQARNIRNAFAAKLKVDPRLVASNKDLDLFIRKRNARALQFLTGWRAKEFAKNLKNL